MNRAVKKFLPLLILGVFILGQEFGLAQTIGRKKATMELHSYNPIKDDGEIVLEMDVRMADCVSHIEISNEHSKKPLVVEVSEENYYLSEDGEEQIYMKVIVCTMKDILKKKKEVPAGLTVYSKSGKPIFTRQITIVREELIASLDRK
jgi:hypothetical protein